MKNEVVTIKDGNLQLDVEVNPEQDTVWLTQAQMALLFGVKQNTLSEHISNILESGEVNETSFGKTDKSTEVENQKFITWI